MIYKVLNMNSALYKINIFKFFKSKIKRKHCETPSKEQLVQKQHDLINTTGNANNDVLFEEIQKIINKIELYL
ncbi:hypothetical protein M2459_003106 [Parabacteroides sp. PF5-5]|nr:hypothetical protein [Parabacteroides sp. PH5-39]MDH6317291.1 hypothetical protein [Parabacteroides sp. PF5-13]MDH6320499.1 hypothetical protein [Parabacteroides sp. PH5-13]MDH6324339.1 hypothetical protein [Parabacteroides sp. PH5-8]MDH6328535.1 hypothetical protein [Parabacteroides sp. PH5-41]MDH6336337.1 hypothetical protein [Parabacteroides sp. PF5-5]MDH6347342.1 hypothetical protein [Parabacteroides sp. PH5-46]MDH6362363.1 hypothetical protein [Parabacteroides sp. PH5-16]MDH6378031.